MDFNDGFPTNQGWYECELDGEPAVLRYFHCEVSGRDEWVDKAGRYMRMHAVKWAGDAMRTPEG